MTYYTTPIYYINADPHIGHAYSTLAADTLKRLDPGSVLLTGTDEHGQKVYQAAQDALFDPKDWADIASSRFEAILQPLNIRNDNFIRTTDPDHIQNVQKVLQRLYDSDDIYLGTYSGYYCVGCETYYSEKDASDRYCPEHKTALQEHSEPTYLFRIEKYRQQLLDHLANNPTWIYPHKRANEVLSWLKDPLQDLAISRPEERLTWGVPLPFAPEYVTYVWIDALCNYLTGANRLNTDISDATHILGKDIVRHHAVIWPCLLLALGESLPKKLIVHGHLTRNGERISKTAKNGIDPVSLIHTWDADIVRSYLLGSLRFGEDSDVTDSGLKAHYTELSHTWGNLVNRVASLCVKNNITSFETPYDAPSQILYDRAVQRSQALTAQGDLTRVYQEGIAFARAINSRVEELAPWKLEGADQIRALNELVFALVGANSLLAAFLPRRSQKIAIHLGTEIEQRSWSEFSAVDFTAIPELLFAHDLG